ncbi:MAG: CYTH domain-containing protein [Candidatus Paceibacterota bacterium]|jgi:CYTH domain-containing protein
MAETLSGNETSPSKEIERKFVISALPAELDLSAFEHDKIRQGYLVNDGQAAVRVRQKGAGFYITYKGAPTGHVAERVELETALTQEQFDTLWPGTEGRRVEKTRYKIPYNDHTIELDVFEGANQGHILAEVEFATTDESDAFVPPEWFTADVTADKRFGNASIADNGFPEQ